MKKSIILILAVLALSVSGCHSSPGELAQTLFVEFPVHVADEATFGAWDLTNDTPPPKEPETLETPATAKE